MNKTIETLFKTSIITHTISNYVTINDIANGIIFAGGSPLMSDEIEEMADISEISQCIYLNIGTLNTKSIESMNYLALNNKDKPILLDVVGVGCSKLRFQCTIDLLATNNITCIKGNYDEISYLYDQSQQQKSLDVMSLELNQQAICENVALKYNCIVLMTGKDDYLSDGTLSYKISEGHHNLTGITGSGCLLGAYLTPLLYLKPKLEEFALLVGYYSYCSNDIDTNKMYDFKNEFMNQISLLKYFKDWDVIKYEKL